FIKRNKINTELLKYFKEITSSFDFKYTAHADDFLSTLFLSFTRPILIFPSMNPNMYSNAATQANIATLRQRGLNVIEPEAGTVVCGAKGKGRLPAWETCLFHIKKALWPKRLAGKKVLISAGPTREPIDPVRFISNRSSGKMGYKLAEAAALRGAEVHLVTGPVALDAMPEVNLHRVETAEEMAKAIFSLADNMDIIIMAAAVSDYSPAKRHTHKLKKSEEKLSLELVRTTDILAQIGHNKTDRLVLVGFCAESHDLEKNAFSKLEKKNLDLIVANDITLPGAGFDVETNKVLIIDREENVEELPLMHKALVSEHILDKIQELMDI
ncbi:MAG: bifunctional phosphopantothenoylcysteine decarboxylase/phosphopantothenate--cysteine ligase CoaBC, partial [Thermodesulfatator sp.]